MSDEQEVTLGEVYRLCQSIDAKVEKQNGRVRKLEDAVTTLRAFGFFGMIGVGLVVDWLRHKLGIS